MGQFRASGGWHDLKRRLHPRRACTGNARLFRKGKACSGKGCVMISTSLNYRLLSTDLTKSLKQDGRQDRCHARDSKYYLDNIGKVKSIDDFIKNKRLFSFAMKAFGLQDMTYATGFMKKGAEGGRRQSRRATPTDWLTPSTKTSPRRLISRPMERTPPPRTPPGSLSSTNTFVRLSRKTLARRMKA